MHGKLQWNRFKQSKVCLFSCSFYMTRKERFRFIIDYFQQHIPDAETELLYDGPYQLLVAVILSGQCTDKRVNMTTPAIFEKYPDAYALAKAEYEDLFSLIKSISYPGN